MSTEEMFVPREIHYNIYDMVQESFTYELNLPDIETVKSYHPRDNSPYLLVECEPRKRYAGGCPTCHSSRISAHGSMKHPRYIHDINAGITQVDLLVHVPRYICEECGTTFNHKFDSIPDNKQMTKRLIDQLRCESFAHPFVEVANKFGISDTTVANFFDEYATELEAARGTITAPKHLGIDEKHIVNSLRGVLVDLDSGKLLEMTANNKRESMKNAIMSMSGWENIELVTMDMASSYRNLIQEILPYATIVIDKYHVYQDLYNKIAKCKSKITNYINERIAAEPDQRIQNEQKKAMLISSQNPYLFKFGAKKLAAKESRYTAMAEICGTFREFNHLRLIKEGFERIYDCKDRTSAIQNYEEWTKLVPPSSKKKKEKWEEEYNLDSSLFEDIQTFANTMRKLNTEIFNFFDPGMDYTNAVAEGVNCFVERVNRQGNGYGYKRLRAKALFYGQVAQPPKYRFDHRKEPIFEESSCSSDAYAFTIGFLSFDSFRNKKIIGYEEYYDLECEESQNWQQPWTVFDLLP